MTRDNGRIEVITGSMFSGKTTELLRRIEKLQKENKKFEVFNFYLDKRYGDHSIISHDGYRIHCKMVSNAEDMMKYIKEPLDVVIIDEIHFFGKDIVKLCRWLADIGKLVITSGLDKNFKGEKFPTTDLIMKEADDISRFYAICKDCGAKADYSHKISGNPDIIDIGAEEKYKPLCKNCFEKNFKKEK